MYTKTSRLAGIRELRNELKLYLDGQTIVRIGDTFKTRALLVPLPDGGLRRYRGLQESDRKAILKAVLNAIDDIG